MSDRIDTTADAGVAATGASEAGPAETLAVNLGEGVVAELPLQWIGDDLGIYSFILLDKVKWVKASAWSLLKKIRDRNGTTGGIDVLLTPEAKAITLAYELAVSLGFHEYVVARKSRKAYMTDPISVDVRSITTQFTHRCGSAPRTSRPSVGAACWWSTTWSPLAPPSMPCSASCARSTARSPWSPACSPKASRARPTTASRWSASATSRSSTASVNRHQSLNGS